MSKPATGGTETIRVRFLIRNKRLQKLDSNLELDPVCASHYQLWALCRSCIDHFSTVRTEETSEQLSRRCLFVGYAARYIFNHAEKAMGEGLSARDDEMGRWLRENNGWLEWWKLFICETDSDWIAGDCVDLADTGLLQILSLSEHREVMKLYLENGTDVNAQGGYYGNVLQAVAFQGWEGKEIIELLLEKGADINAQGGYYGNALQAASCIKSRETVEMLLETGADVNAQGGYFGSALQAASLRPEGQGKQEIMQLLLDKGAKVDT